MEYDKGKWHWRRRQGWWWPITCAIISIIFFADENDAFLFGYQYQPSSIVQTISKNHHRYTRNFVKLRQMGNDYLSNLSPIDDGTDDDDDANPSTQSSSLSTTNVKNVFKRSLSGIESVARSTSSGIESVARTASSGIDTVARSTSSGIESVARTATSGIDTVARSTSSGIEIVARKTSSGIESVAKKGAKDFRMTTVYAGRAVKRGAKDSFKLAERSVSDTGKVAMNLVERGVSDTGKVAKWIDSQAKAGTEAVGASTKRTVLNFTGKSTYEFGDVSKETVRRIAAGEVNMQDAILLLKILLAIGGTIGPLAELLPFTFLLEAVNISMEQKVGGKVMEVLAKSLDSRIVGALFTSDDRNLIGDVAKRSLLSGVLAFTGKNEYASGDIQRTILEHENEDNSEEKTLDIDVSEFAEWDALFIEKLGAEIDEEVSVNPEELDAAKEMDMKIALALEECDALSKTRNIGF